MRVWCGGSDPASGGGSTTGGGGDGLEVEKALDWFRSSVNVCCVRRRSESCAIRNRGGRLNSRRCGVNIIVTTCWSVLWVTREALLAVGIVC